MFMYKIVVGEDKSLLVFSLYSDIFLYSTMDLQTQRGLKEKKNRREAPFFRSSKLGL